MSAAQAIAYLNAQRSRNGIPAGVVERPEWSDGCVKHANYLTVNGGGIDFSNPHDEDPSKPGYTPEGQAAARSAVLGGTYTSEANPWEGSPIHLMQLLGPKLAETGYGPGCMWTWPGYTRPAPGAPPPGVPPPSVAEPPPATYTYPGPGTTIYPTFTAAEWPFTPGEFVGLPQGTATGPYLYVFAFGWYAGEVSLTSATLIGASGPVEVRLVDNHTADARGEVGRMLPVGGIVIPVNPLAPQTEYHAIVEGHTTAAIAGTQQLVPLRWDWTFRTDAMPTTPTEAIPTGDADTTGNRATAALVRADSAKSKLRVDVNPNKGTGYWKFRIQKRQSNNTWVTLGRTYKTRGSQETRTVNLKKGTYRVVVKAKYGLSGSTSREVYLRR